MSQATKFYTENLAKYEELTKKVQYLLDDTIRKKKVGCLSVSGRTKTEKSVIDKVARKEYTDIAAQMTDISGIRVITFLDNQVKEVSNIIYEIFEVDKDNSRDKAELLGSDKVGYRSVHFVCKLGDARKQLSEYVLLGNLKFEIQVRTVLQHAWAELSHDHSYKLGWALPTDQQRKLNLYAGLLEIADRAFDEISQYVDQRKVDLANEPSDVFSMQELNNITLSVLLDKTARHSSIEFSSHLFDKNEDRRAIEDLNAFGIQTVGGVSKLLTKEFLSRYKEAGIKGRPGIAFLRHAMMFADMRKYFSRRRSTWRNLNKSTYELLCKKYPPKQVNTVLQKHNISVQED